MVIVFCYCSKEKSEDAMIERRYAQTCVGVVMMVM